MQDPKGKNVRPVSRQVSNVPAPVRHWHTGLGRPKTERTEMNTITRRQALSRLGVTTAALTVGAGATLHVAQTTPSTKAENPELLRLHGQLTENLAERAAAKSDIGRIAEKWQDRWPLVPEELLGPTTDRDANDGVMWKRERDIAGKLLRRDPSVFSKRTLRRYRLNAFDGPVAFCFEKADSLEERLHHWMDSKPTGRTPAALSRNTKWREDGISDLRNRIDLTQQYDTKIAHLREISGMNAAKERLARARAGVEATREALAQQDAWTPDGLILKALVVRDELNENYNGLNLELFAGTPLGRMYRTIFQIADSTIDAA